MCTTMLSIKPEYIRRILKGTKKYEFRKIISRKEVSRIVLYCKIPTKKVVGWVDVLGVISGSPKNAWKNARGRRGCLRRI